MRGDSCLADASTAMMADLSEQHRQLHKALTQAAQWRSEPVSEIGEWTGGRVEDPFDDFIGRYMFAFWRLISQGITAAEPVPTVPSPSRAVVDRHRGVVPPDPEVRVIRLTASSAGTADASDGRTPSRQGRNCSRSAPGSTCR
ncbi:hypothetical protein ACFRNJ_18335 [Streptomyces sp. NPDC056721]|uniref:hypothetical protein n=1 Tax=Streptomyces sp. NPDC056721 TaxID=3345923 RepID=UPI0036911B50